MYVLASWEGSAHDSRTLNDALERPHDLRIPQDPQLNVPLPFSRDDLDNEPFWDFKTQVDACRGDLSNVAFYKCVSGLPILIDKLCGSKPVAARIQLFGCYMLYEDAGFPQISGMEILLKTCNEKNAPGDRSIKFGEVAMTIGRMVNSRLDVTKLYEEVIAMDGYNKEFLGDAFDYLEATHPTRQQQQYDRAYQKQEKPQVPKKLIPKWVPQEKGVVIDPKVTTIGGEKKIQLQDSTQHTQMVQVTPKNNDNEFIEVAGTRMASSLTYATVHHKTTNRTTPTQNYFSPLTIGALGLDVSGRPPEGERNHISL
ncbi:Cysteine-rich repeat secretory protein 11 [Capsicum baccatum]|uniref:Cysteine-rich repeat secretory protein 11 n=1 Tax=Capsicum baccatum TaxID=33114 RepID=A0A2G2WRW9_CAPBA|nr:Cysteine-rich repeat secretory protein 11 [Capsicum baccatum]